MPNFFIAAYTTASSDWDLPDDIAYFQALSNNSSIIGIEHPFVVNSKKYDFHFLEKNIPDHWSIIITLVPSTMTSLCENNYFGLASKNENGRVAAVKLMEKTAQYITDLNNLFDRKIVKAVHFQTAPKNSDQEILGNSSALKKSLHEIKNFDWEGAQLNLEHCDAHVSKQIAQKGFLKLEEEIEIISGIKNMGITLNWARSVIEARSSLGVLKHIQLAQASNLLKGFFFSGCDTSFKDIHLPPNPIQPESVLTQKEIIDAFNLLNNSVYVGIKVSNQTVLKTPEQAAKINFKTIETLELSHA